MISREGKREEPDWDISALRVSREAKGGDIPRDIYRGSFLFFFFLLILLLINNGGNQFCYIVWGFFFLFLL